VKIALVLSSPPGYTETFFNSQIKGLKEKGYEVTLFTGNSSLKYQSCKHIMHPVVHKNSVVQIFLMIYRGFTLLPYLKVVKKYIRLERKQGTPTTRIIEKIYINASLLKYQGDWIHFGFATVALGRELVPQAIGAKMAVSFRGYDINVYPLKHRNCYNLLWQHLDKVHSISRYLLNKAYDLGLDHNKPFQIIYPAVELKKSPKRHIYANKGNFRIVTVARFGWIKGLELLTEVAFRLKNDGLQFEWVLIGTGNSSEKERFLYDLNQKQICQQLIHKGQCTHQETLDILKDCDFYVQTSWNEGFCNAVLEAQSLGIPCVAFNVGGLPENIVDKETGWLITPFDTLEMAKRIQEKLNLPTEQKKIISQKAIDRVREEFNLVKQKEAFNKFYKS
jgi:colanic acid/amylovoran biosynthesis glycosyltransferase